VLQDADKSQLQFLKEAILGFQLLIFSCVLRADFKTLMDSRSPLEVPGDGGISNVFHVEVFQSVTIQGKTSAVGGEEERPSRCQKPCRILDELDMIPLYIKIAVHGF